MKTPPVYKQKIKYCITATVIFFAFSCNSNDRQDQHSTSQKNRPELKPDSIYVKFDTSARYINGISILDIKHSQQDVEYDTNFVSYPYSAYSTLVYFPIPSESYYPVQPGDSIIVSPHKNTDIHYPHISVLNNNAFTAAELNFANELGNRNASIFEYMFKKTGTLRERHELTLVTIDSASKAGILSDEYVFWISQEAEYAYLKLSQTKAMTEENIDVTNVLNRPDHLRSYNYRSLLWKVTSNELGDDLSLEKLLSVADQFYKGATRDYIVYQFASDLLSEKISGPDRENALSTLARSFEDTTYYALIKDRFLNKYKLDATLDEPMLQANGESLSWQQMVARYKGRYVYIDIWASWCAPCRVEMPNSLGLKQKYKDIAFVYLSTDKVQQDWLKANLEEQLPLSDSYLFFEASNSAFLKQYEVESIPRYFILDTDGNVIADNAPRPSDPGLQQFFDIYSN